MLARMTRRLRPLAFAAASCASAWLALPAVGVAADASVRYRVALDAAMTALEVEVCTREGSGRVRFEAPEADALAPFDAVSRSGGGDLERERNTVIGARWRPGECLRYRVALDAGDAAGRRARAEAMYRLDDDLVTRPAAWLLRPVRLARADDATITFDLPAGVSLSAPWRTVDPSQHTARSRTFALGRTPPEWPALVAFGRFDDAPVAVGRDAGGADDRASRAGAIRPVVLGRATPGEALTLRAYAVATANDVAATFPRAFRLRPQIAMLATGPQRDAIPFGESYRGGGSALVLYVDPARPLDDYFGNWTLTHELVHLVHPYLGDGGRWISEGIATYYQNVLRARAGRIGADAAWRSLEAGFGRGRADRDERTIFATAAGAGHYMRVYWSGTALALRADVAWRTRGIAPTSLDAVLDRHFECCRSDGMQPPRAFLAELDRLAGGEPVAVPLYDALGARVEFPSVAAAYDALGMTRDGVPVGANAVREAIMRGPRRGATTRDGMPPRATRDALRGRSGS